MGYWLAGFEVVGVDIAKQPRYPFSFFQADAIDFAQRYSRAFDAIHASPPCQAHSDMSKGSAGSAGNHECFIGRTRAVLCASGKPYVIENVDGAPLVEPVRLCGTSFDELRVIRHRLFEANWSLMVPSCESHPLLYMAHDKRRPHQGELDEMADFVSVTGGGNCSVAAARDAMGTVWMTKEECNEAIPPTYTEFIGRQLLRVVKIAA